MIHKKTMEIMEKIKDMPAKSIKKIMEKMGKVNKRMKKFLNPTPKNR